MCILTFKSLNFRKPSELVCDKAFKRFVRCSFSENRFFNNVSILELGITGNWCRAIVKLDNNSRSLEKYLQRIV